MVEVFGEGLSVGGLSLFPCYPVHFVPGTLHTALFPYLYPMDLRELLLQEITIHTSRASGPGGQHVNRTESRVELQWNMEHSEALNDMQKTWLRERIGRRFTDTGLLILVSQRSRSQVKNREDVVQRFLNLVEANVIPPVIRKATRPSRKAHERRLGAKKQQSEKKDRRSTDWKKDL